MVETILVVDDEPTQRFLAEHMVRDKLGYNVVALDGGQAAIDYIRQHIEPAPDLILLDLFMPQVGGLDVIRVVRNLRPQLPIIVLTVHNDLTRAVEAIKAGAQDFLVKPVPIERLRVSIQSALRLRKLGEEVVRLQRNVNGQTSFNDIIGQSATIKSALALAQRGAVSSIPVLIEGESGVGKELFARAIHGCSARAGKPLITVNCGAIPDSMAASILFGHEKDSFNGAVNSVLGKFREAEGGTLFLDEVGELKPDIQAKLLHVLQEGEAQAFGAKEVYKTDIRLISATSADLLQKVRNGQFREDLYYRLNVFPLHVPALRHRREDIRALAHYFLARFNVLEHKSIEHISDAAMEFLLQHPWPGNVRQLENIIFRAVVLANSQVLELKNFQHGLMQVGGIFNAKAANGSTRDFGTEQYLGLMDEHGNLKRMDDVECEMIQFALRFYKGHMSEVAKRLGIGRSTLYRKIQDRGIAVAAT